jgi:hypothetical protein
MITAPMLIPAKNVSRSWPALIQLSIEINKQVI